MKNIKKLLSVFIAMSFMLAFFSSCTSSSNSENNTTTLQDATVTEAVTTVEETTYPELKIEITSDNERIYEKMVNYTFIPDEKILGTWQTFGFLSSEFYNDEDSLRNIVNSYLENDETDNFLWKNVTLYNNGAATITFTDWNFSVEWTKGYILNVYLADTISAYIIKNVGGIDYMFVEWKPVDYTENGVDPYYYIFKKDIIVIHQFDDIRNWGIQNSNLTKFAKNMLTLTFNEKTIFPPRDKMPSDDKYLPENIMETGKNPGLGVRVLHKQGITGKGVNVAIIDQPLFLNHPEYAGKIIEYKDFGCDGENSSMHGPLVTSLLAGETIGTAPGVKIYYAAFPSWKADASYSADAVDWVVETNKNLPEAEKIRIISLSGSTTPSDPRFTNGEKYLESVKKAQEAGILVIDCSPENGIIGTCGYNYDNPEDITLCKPVDESSFYLFNTDRDILAPVLYRTTAEQYTNGDFSYQYSYDGGLSSAAPWAAGILAMGWQVKPELTPDEIMKILFDTAYVDKDGNKYIYPTAFIDYIKNN